MQHDQDGVSGAVFFVIKGKHRSKDKGDKENQYCSQQFPDTSSENINTVL